MSSVRTFKALDAQKKHKNVFDDAIQLNIDPKLVASLEGYPALSGRLGVESAKLSLARLMSLYKETNKQIKNNKKDAKLRLLLEEYKLALICSVNTGLSIKGGFCAEEAGQDEEALKLSFFRRAINAIKNNKYARYAGFALFTVLGLAKESMENFLGFQASLTSLVPGLVNPLLMIVSLGIMALSSILFISFEMSMLQELFGVKLLGSELKELLELEAKQVKHSKQLIDKISTRPVSLNPGQYAGYCDLAQTFGNDITKKLEKRNGYKEHPAKKVIKIAMIGLGAVTMATWGYFTGISLLGGIAVGLLGTPVGWAIIGGVIATSLVLFLAMQAGGIDDFFNPAKEKYKYGRDKLIKFNKRYGDIKDGYFLESQSHHKAYFDHVSTKQGKALMDSGCDDDVSLTDKPRPTPFSRRLTF